MPEPGDEGADSPDSPVLPEAVMFEPLAEPTWTKRIGTAAFPAFVPEVRRLSALGPQRKSITTSTPAANCSSKAVLSDPSSTSGMVTSAPSAATDLSVSRFRPVAMTFAAPKCLAICTARRPAAPVAPLTSTVSPSLSFARSLKAAHDDIPGLAMAAAVTSSSPSGGATQCAEDATVLSAMLPCGAVGRKK